LKAATLVRNAAAVIAGFAQAVPFSGDAGADAAFAVVDLAMSAADIALDSYERYTLAPREDRLDDLNNQLDVAIANHVDAMTNFNMATVLKETMETSRNISAQSYLKAWVARDAVSKGREQAVKAYDVGQSLEHGLDVSEAKPLSVQANRV